jgi:hypothetical protein
MDEEKFWKQAEAAMAALNLEEEEKKNYYNKEYQQHYYTENKETILTRSKLYYLTHTEKMKKANYAYMKKKITCECGKELTYNSKYRHRQSIIHFKNLLLNKK